MSQKYKSFSKGRTSDFGSELPPGVKRVGYLRKLKKMKKRFFVLHVESNYGVARLEYYSSEKKWRFGCEPRRCIELKSCLNISRKLHSKQKNVIAFYTRDDCFSVVCDSSEDLEDWLKDILEVQKNSLDFDDNSSNRHIYEYLWQVVIDKHDLEYDKLIAGPYRVALTAKSLYLIKMNPSGESDYLEFPLMSIRRCGHSKDHFFIELGRSAVTGAGEIYMATDATIVAQNMHETVLSAMKSSKIREDPFPRPRSASSSENSNPISTSRPIGVVAPQTVSSANSSGFSSSRERCDSLPTRPQTIVGNAYNHFVLSALSSPYTSNCNISRQMNSRPHSMYEWPSLNSPSMRNTIFSPNSLSSATGCGSSTEEIDSIKQQSLNCYPHSLKLNGNSPSNLPMAEGPDDYLKMSPNNENATPFEYNIPAKRSKDVSTIPSDYVDMKASSKTEFLKKPPANYTPMAPGGASEEIPIIMQSGYMDMSPSNSLPKSISNSQTLEKVSGFHLNQNNELEHPKTIELEKVLSLLQVEDKSSVNASSVQKPSVLINNISCNLNTLSDSPTKSCIENIPFVETCHKNIMNENSAIGTKPPIPERTYQKSDSKTSIYPPLPIRKTIDSCTSSHNKECMKGLNVCSKQDPISQIPREKFNSDVVDVCYEDNSLRDTKGNNHLQNTNFSCCSNSENNTSVFCAPPCFGTMPSKYVAQNKANNKAKQPELSTTGDVNKNNKFSSSNDTCDNLEFQYNFDSVTLSKNVCSDQAMNSEPITQSGDYVNVNFEKTDCSTVSKSISSRSIIHKNSMPSLPSSYLSDPNYSNIQFGKPICPLPNPILASSESLQPAFNTSVKCDGNISQPSDPNSGPTMKHEDLRGQNILKSPSGPTYSGSDSPKTMCLTPKFKNIPNTLPAFRKQMSAPAGPLALRPELPSPGRKSSCPVTATAGVVKPPLPPAYVCPIRPMHLQSHGATTAHLRVSASRSPDHSSVSSISSASDEISSTHSSPKTLSTSQNFGASNLQTISDSQYENVVIPERPSTSSRPPSVSSEKELNYASLDLAPSTKEVLPRSPTVVKPSKLDKEDSLTYAEIDFTKSEGLKNISGSIREGRL